LGARARSASRRAAPRCALPPAADKSQTRLPRRRCGPAPGLCLKRWPLLGGPALDRRFIALGRAADRLLGAPPSGAEQPADVVRVVAHAELVRDDSGYPFAGPDLAEEAERLCA